ncbi:MAG: DNA polymerase III subunit gamma/tau [Fusobacterium sp.]|nr:DNA polymerase III subunit gamma/tau [Fusobacterium sp.]
MHITLYRKYRPASFEEISGENEIVKTLKLSLKNKATSHAYLFSGPRGVGKTTTARLIAKGVNCLELLEDGEPCNHCKNCTSINEGRFSDLIEIDAASNRSIDEIRNLKEKINYQPVEGLKKVYIIDEAHMLTKEAFNALLKTLEEPPSHVIFILATTELEKILPTIISRCQRYDFKTLELSEMKKRLEFILKEEKIEMEEDVFPVIYETSAGSMRDSISILERLIISSNGEKINLDIAEKTLGITPSAQIKKVLDKILEKNEYDIIEELEKIAYQSYDIELFFKDLAKYCKNLMVKGELDYNLGFNIISIIYDVLSKFKFEDDKKLVAYVIVADILSKCFRKNNFNNSNISSSSNLSQNFKKEISYEQNTEIKKEKTKEVREEKQETFKINLEFADIKSSWENLITTAGQKKISFKVFLLGTEPLELENNILKIGFKYASAYAKEQMETAEYQEEFTKIVREFFNEQKLILKYEIIGNKEKKEQNKTEFHKKIIDFFEGND